MSASWGQAEATSSPAAIPIGHLDTDDERYLLHAFRSFAEAAASLELSYGELRGEVERLERELAVSNGELARSSEENSRIRAQLDRILAGLPCGVLVISKDGRVLKTNLEALRILGLHPQQGELTSFGQLPSAVRELLEFSRRIHAEPEIQLEPGNDAVRWLAARHASLPDHSSVFILRDTSERRRLDQIEARSERDRQLAEISALLAHEIRNPLGSLELFAGLLADSELTAEQRQWLEHVQAGLRTLAATVNNVLHFHSTAELQRSPVDLGKLLEWAKDFFLPLARRSDIVLSLQNGLPGVVFAADRHRLEQVLLNLIRNSIHVMPSGGWIELNGRMSANGTSVTIEVADTGPGIPTEDLRRIFEAGFSRRCGSPGLGLAVCRKIVEQHGGTIAAGNRAGSGAVFTVTFPVSAGTEGVEP